MKPMSSPFLPAKNGKENGTGSAFSSKILIRKENQALPLDGAITMFSMVNQTDFCLIKQSPCILVISSCINASKIQYSDF